LFKSRSKQAGIKDSNCCFQQKHISHGGLDLVYHVVYHLVYHWSLPKHLTADKTCHDQKYPPIQKWCWIMS